MRTTLLVIGSMTWMALLVFLILAVAKVERLPSTPTSPDRINLKERALPALAVLGGSVLFLVTRYGLIGSLVPADHRILHWDEIQHVFVASDLGWSPHGAVWLYGVAQYCTGLSLMVLVPALSGLLGLLTFWLIVAVAHRASGSRHRTAAVFFLALLGAPLVMAGARLSFGHVTAFLWILAFCSAWEGRAVRRWRPVARLSTVLLGFCGPLAGLMMIPSALIIYRYGPRSSRWGRPIWALVVGLTALNNVVFSLSDGLTLGRAPVGLSVAQAAGLLLFICVVVLGMVQAFRSGRSWARWLVSIETALAIAYCTVSGPYGWQTSETLFMLALWIGCPFAAYGLQVFLDWIGRSARGRIACHPNTYWLVLLILLTVSWIPGVQSQNHVDRMRGDWTAHVHTEIWPKLDALIGASDVVLLLPEHFPVLPAEWSELLSFEVASHTLLPTDRSTQENSNSRSCYIWQIYRVGSPDPDALLGSCAEGGRQSIMARELVRWEDRGAVSRLVACALSYCAQATRDPGVSMLNSLTDEDMTAQISLWLRDEVKP